jgi:anti-sigma B factor antagonist
VRTLVTQWLDDIYAQALGGTVDLSVATREQDGRMIVEVSGEIDVYSAPTLRDQLNTLVAGGHHHLVVDMQGVEFLDSTGLGVLVGGLKRVRTQNGSMQLVCSTERVLKVFRITGLTKVFAIHDSLDDALAASPTDADA